MTSAKWKFKINVISLAVLGALSLMAAPVAVAQTLAVGGCDSYDPIDGQVIECTVGGTNPDSKGVRTPRDNTTINNVEVSVRSGVVLEIGGSTIGLGSGSKVVNEGTLITRLRFGYGVSSGVNGRSTAGGNSITNESAGRISTNGSDSHGIYIDARQTDALGNTITNRGEVTTAGARADGIRLFTTARDVQNVIENTGSIQTAGVRAHGIHVRNTSGLVEIRNTGSITVSDSTSYAVYIDGSANLLVNGALSSPGTAIFVNPVASNDEATTVTLGRQATIAGGISLSSTRTSEKLVFDGLKNNDLSNSISGVNLIETRNGAVVALTASQYDFGASQITLAKDSRLTIAGQLSASTSLTLAGQGELILTANNLMSADVLVNGSTLQLNANQAAGKGAIDIASGARLRLGANNLTIANNIVLRGANGIDIGNFSTTLAGDISGAGGLTKEGTGTLTLAGQNTYLGATNVLQGVLSLKASGALPATDVAIASGASLRMNDLDQSVGAISGQGAIDLGSGTLTTSVADRSRFAGRISGSGVLVKRGAGTLTLSARNSYSGGTLVQSGVLALSATGAAGTGQITLAENTTLRANRSLTVGNAVRLQAVGAIATGEHAVTVAGVVSGAGQLKKLDSGVLTLTNANTYRGGTLLERGTIVAANDQALGTGTLTAGQFDVVLGAGKSELMLANAVRLDHDLIVDTAGELMVLSGEVSGVGRLIKRGSGVLELASDNTYLGGTVIEQGTLALDVNAAASSGTLTMASDTVLQAQTSLSVANEIKLGGPVQVNTQGFDVTLSGVIGNNSVGQLIKTGLGTLTLTGQNQYSGGTIIREGRLAVLGSLASGVQVQAQTELAGTGTIGGDVFNAGTIAPAMGSGPSRLTIVGNYVGEGGTFATVLGGTASAIVADQLAIEGQGNRASGSTVISVTDPTGVLGRPTVGDGILLVDVSEGATSTTDAFSAPRIAAGAYEYTLNRGGEESAQSWYLRADNDAPAPPVIVTPKVAQREEVALYPALPSLARQYLWSINGTLDDRRGAPDILSQWQEQPIAWGRFVGQGNKTAPGNADKGPGLKTNDWALQLGADVLRSSSDWGQWRVGPVLTLGRSVGGAYNARGTAKTGDVALNAYSLGLNATVASTHGGYADLLLIATRLTGIEARSPLGTSISTTGWAYSGSLEGGWRVAMTDRVSVTPQAQIYSTTVDLNNTADAFSRIDMATNTSLLGRLGVKLAYDNQQAQGPATTFWARASVYSTLAGKNAQTSFLNVLGTNATTFDSQAPGTWFALDAALNVQTSRNTAVQFGVGYQTSFNSQFQGVYGQVNVRYAF